MHVFTCLRPYSLKYSNQLNTNGIDFIYRHMEHVMSCKCENFKVFCSGITLETTQFPLHSCGIKTFGTHFSVCREWLAFKTSAITPTAFGETRSKLSKGIIGHNVICISIANLRGAWIQRQKGNAWRVRHLSGTWLRNSLGMRPLQVHTRYFSSLVALLQNLMYCGN